MNMHFGSVDSTWEQHNLLQAPLLYNDQDTQYKAIIQNGNLAAIVHKSYTLLPNEEVVKIADVAAKASGLVPFNEFTGNWFNRMDKHVILSDQNRKIHALYAINKPYEVNGDKMHLGVGVHNSIDGSTAFGCGVFTFRNACSNMVLAGTRNYEQRFDQRKTIEYLYKRHTKGLAPDALGLQESITAIMERAQEILKVYRSLALQQINEDLVRRIKASRLSNKVLPEFLQAKPDEIKVPDISKWDLYNDITANIWHNEKSGMRTKEHQFTVLHQMMPLEVRA